MPSQLHVVLLLSSAVVFPVLRLRADRNTTADVVLCERSLAASCSGVNHFNEPAGACPPDEFDGVPPAARSFFVKAGTRDLGCISRSLRFGRFLWCLARSPVVRTVLELFTGSGCGSTLLLAHGLASGGPGRYLLSVELESKFLGHAELVLKATGVGLGGFARLDGATGLSASEMQQIVARPGAWFLHGDFLGYPGLPEVVCRTFHGIDLVMLDTVLGVDLRSIWPLLESTCSPRFVAIHNVNLRAHAGWIRDHLLRKGGWLELARGSHPSLWNDTDREIGFLDAETAGSRSWSLLGRNV